MSETTQALREHLEQLKACRKCADIFPPPVVGNLTPQARIMLVGQAPGPKEQVQGRPFVWTAGTTLFRWFAELGVKEDVFRDKVYMAAVIRCFPGKMANLSGDRKPSKPEMENCRPHLQQELDLIKPSLVLPVGRMAMDYFLRFKTLDEVVGGVIPPDKNGHSFDLIPLPHPSGLSRWTKMEPGKTLLAKALETIRQHPAWRETFRT